MHRANSLCTNLPQSTLCRAVKFSLLCEMHASTSCTSKYYAVPRQHWDTLGLTTWCQHLLRENSRSISTVSLCCSNPFCITKREQKSWKKSIWSIQWGKAKFQETSDDLITERHTIIFFFSHLAFIKLSKLHPEGRISGKILCLQLVFLSYLKLIRKTMARDWRVCNQI